MLECNNQEVAAWSEIAYLHKTFQRHWILDGIIVRTIRDRTILWESSDPAVARVDCDGWVFALKEGRTAIRAISKQNKALWDVCEVLVPQVCSEYLYVSPNGDDSAEGTAEHPLRSIQEARNRIRRRKEKTAVPEGGINIYLRGGTYRLQRRTAECQDAKSAIKNIQERKSVFAEASGSMPKVFKAFQIQTRWQGCGRKRWSMCGS